IGVAAEATARPVVVEAPPVVVAAPVQAIAAAPAPQRAAAGQPSCVAQLSPESRTIYNATRGAMTPASNLKDVVTAQTRALVMSGKVQSSSARNSATSAGECLAQAQ
ncbi:MAG: hypothetical protein K2Y29_01885, partial [Beijerinckiaceae bacterium]|nr:hypothetical protein [Beijerinckiaceae bacterium]